MARRVQSKGDCVYCKRTFSRAGLAKHLQSCRERQQAITQAHGKGSQTLYHIQVQDAYSGDFWLHLEVNGNATLKTLDDYLRQIWLECCGHLSHFAVGDAWGNRKLAMSRKVHQVLQPGVELVHVYDYGSTSETRLKAIDVRQGPPSLLEPAVARPPPQEPPTTPCYPILTCMSRACKAASRLTASHCGKQQPRAEGAAGAESGQRPATRDAGILQGCFQGLRSERAGDKMPFVSPIRLHLLVDNTIANAIDRVASLRCDHPLFL